MRPVQFPAEAHFFRSNVLTTDIFHFRNFSMRQAPSGQRVNTDSCVFGAVIGQGVNPQKILDIGTGTGVLALMLAERFSCASVTAIEPEWAIAEIAKVNFSSSSSSNRMDLKCLRAQELDATTHGVYDFVVCNPPYFQNSLLSNDRLRAVARHNSDLSPFELYQAMARVMCEDGSAWVSFPEDSTDLWFEHAFASNLYLASHIIVKDHPTAKPHMAIAGWSKSHTHTVNKETLHYRIEHKGPLSPWMMSFRDLWYPAHYNEQFR